MMALALVALPTIATLGEGGAAADSLLVWHALLLLLLLWALLAPAGERGRNEARTGGALIAAALFLALAAMGTLIVPFAYAAWLTLLELAAFLAVFLLAARSGPRLLPSLRLVVAVTAAAQGLLTLYQRLMLGEPRPAGTFLNPNYLACWLVMALLLSAGTWRRKMSMAAMATWFGLALPAALALFLSGSRGGMLGLAAGLCWLIYRSWRQLRPAEKRLCAAVMLVGILLVGWRLGGRLDEDDPFRYQRLEIWKSSIGMVRDNPWWGCGPGQFPVASSRYQFADGNGPLRYDRAFRIPHSDLVRAFSEFGIPAAIALLAALLLAARAIARRRYAESGAQAALLAVGLQALVDDPSHWPAVYLLTALLFGFLLSAPSPAPAPARLPGSVRAALVLLLVLVFTVGDLGPTMAHLQARLLPVRNLDSGQERALAGVLRLNPVHPDYWRRHAESVAGGSAPLTLESYAVARESAERAIRLNRTDSLNYWLAAKVERRACLELFRDVACRERVSARYRWAQALKPYDARVSLDHGQFLLSAGDPEGARRFAQRALTMEPEGVAARLLLAECLIHQKRPDPERASQLLREAQRLSRRHAGAAAANEYSMQMLTLDQRRLTRLLSMVQP
jgi:O-antigen ligase